MSGPLNLEEFEPLAAERLDPHTYDYYRSGAEDQVTLRRNRAAFRSLSLLPHVLVDVSDVDASCEVLGSSLPAPIGIAPTAFHKLADEEGELATARAAAGAGLPYCLSTLATTSIEEVAEVSDGPRWFQLYVFRDRGLTLELVERAEAAGYTAIVLTVDAPLLGRREADMRNEFTLPEGFTIASVGDGRLDAPPGESGLAAYFAELLDPSLSWEDLEWLTAQTTLPVVVKGIHRADDAERAIEAGARAIGVSNHGARQLDTTPATIEMLPAIADAVGGRAELLLDGGVRRGTDVIKAICLGADFVMLGRPVLWAPAAGGQGGVEDCLALITAELRHSMALCGAPALSDLGRDLVAGPAPP